MKNEINSISTEIGNLGICLSGGGALGFAHIGVLQSLEDNGIFPQRIVGSSMGAIVGTLYAAGYTPANMLQLIKDDKLYRISKLMTFRAGFLKSGLANHSMLRGLIKELIPHNCFEQLQLKLHICVANLNNAKWEIVETGNELDKWVAASATIPGLFETMMIGDVFYVDGGLLNNMPAQGINEFCHTIIGVDVLPHIVPAELNKPIDTLAFAVRAMQHQNSKAGRNLCQFIIEPKAIIDFNEFSFDAYQAIYQQGYDATNKFLAENPRMLELKK
jgi:NTE family protein